MARIYGDEDYDDRLTPYLENAGHDVLTVRQSDRRQGSDAQVLTDATADNRVVVTFNRWHFEKLHRAVAAHSGIVSCTRDDDIPALAARIHAAIAGAGDMAGQHIRVNRLP